MRGVACKGYDGFPAQDTRERVSRRLSTSGSGCGEKTIGVAVCDDLQRIATPVETIKRTKFSQDLKALERIVKDFEAGGFVVGFPLNMDGSEGRSAQSVRDFALELERQISKELFPDGTVWIALVDERLSTDTVDDLVGRSVDKKDTAAGQRGWFDR